MSFVNSGGLTAVDNYDVENQKGIERAETKNISAININNTNTRASSHLVIFSNKNMSPVIIFNKMLSLYCQGI